MNSFLGNTCLVWNLMCLTEALMIKALLLTNFKQFSGINDSFFSMFAGLINVGFSLGSHIALFFLGSLGSDEILTGLRGKPRQISLFYKVHIGTITAISCLSLMAILIKKFEAHWKDKKLVKDVNVMISSTDGRDSRRSVNFGEDKINILSIPIHAINGEERAKSAQGLAKSAMERAKSAPPGMRTLDRQPKQRLINKR